MLCRLGRNVEEVSRIMRTGRKKLFAAREQRETPFIDRTIYTSLNGMLISAYFHAYGMLGDEESKRFGVKSLELVLAERYVDGRLFHAEDVPAVLDDYVNLIDALISAYEATAEGRYVSLAEELMAFCLEGFYDKRSGGFFDTVNDVLGTRLKRVEDVPHPSANAVAVTLLLKLSLMTGKEEYQRAAEQTLRIFADSAREMGVHAGSYYCALDAFFRMIKLTVEAPPAGTLAQAARSIAGLTYAAILYGGDNNRVVPCRGRACYEPIHDAETLVAFGMKIATGAEHS